MDQKMICTTRSAISVPDKKSELILVSAVAPTPYLAPPHESVRKVVRMTSIEREQGRAGAP